LDRAGRVVTRAGKFQQDLELGPHRLISDEPLPAGGDDLGPSPHEFLLAALGSCTSMTIKLYADRKGWPLERVEVELEQEKVDGVHEIRRAVRLHGPLSDEQRARLLEIAEKCPVHRTLTGPLRLPARLL
jgi:putative redox protein